MITAVVFVAVIVVITFMQFIPTSTYAITPGDATNVAPLVSVRGVATAPDHDRIMLTDVYLQRLSVWQWVTSHFQSHVQYVSASELVSPGVSTSELNAQGFLEMRDSKQAAEVTAFRTLGWTVPATAVGALVDAVVSGSPVDVAGLHVGDRVVAINGVATTSSCAIVRAVHDLKPGSAVALRVMPVQVSPTGVLSWHQVTTLSATTTRSPGGEAASPCRGVTGASHSWLGVALENDVHYALPGQVTINTANIGGPSAGLSMTLTLIDKLSRGSLSGGHVVAATGTISINGRVGDVGGVAEKTVAVQRAGAQYFIVPRVEVATARANAQPGLTILGVGTLAQALHDLRAIGGARARPVASPS